MSTIRPAASRSSMPTGGFIPPYITDAINKNGAKVSMPTGGFIPPYITDAINKNGAKSAGPVDGKLSALDFATPEQFKLVKLYNTSPVKWDGKAPEAGSVAKSVFLNSPRAALADGFTYKANLLKNGTVVFQRTGGFAGLTSYSKPFAVK